MQTLFLSVDTEHYIAKPIYNLILCFVCNKDVNLGLMRVKVLLVFNAIDWYDGWSFGAGALWTKGTLNLMKICSLFC